MYYLFQWVFFLIFLIGFVFSTLKRAPPLNTLTTVGEEEDDDVVSPIDDERRRLLPDNVNSGRSVLGSKAGTNSRFGHDSDESASSNN